MKTVRISIDGCAPFFSAVKNGEFRTYDFGVYYGAEMYASQIKLRVEEPGHTTFQSIDFGPQSHILVRKGEHLSGTLKVE